MKKEYNGLVVRHNLDSGNHPYTVIEVKNKLNLNYRVFVPDLDFKIGDKVKVFVESVNHKEKTKEKKDGG